MRIVHVVRTASMLRAFMLPVMREQQRRGHYVCAICGDDEHADALRKDGFDVFDHGLARAVRPINALRAVLLTRRAIIDHRIDAVIVHAAISNIVGRLAGRLAGCRRIVSFSHGLLYKPTASLWHRSLAFGAEWVLGRMTDAMLVMNDHDEKFARKHHFVKRVGGRVLRIPGVGVDVGKFNLGDGAVERAALVDELGLDDADRFVLCVARVWPAKGVYEFADAAVMIAPRRPNAVFLLAGDGSHLERIRERVRRAGVERQVRVLGWRTDVDKMLRAADMFVLPSYHEGLPVSVIEAMACGKPAVASRVRGCEDVVVHGETGFLVPIKDAHTLAQHITELLDDDERARRMGMAGRRRIEDCYALDHCTAAIMVALDEALGVEPAQQCGGAGGMDKGRVREPPES